MDRAAKAQQIARKGRVAAICNRLSDALRGARDIRGATDRDAIDALILVLCEMAARLGAAREDVTASVGACYEQVAARQRHEIVPPTGGEGPRD